MKKIVTCLAILLAVCSVTSGQTESKPAKTDVFPTMVRDALVNSTAFKPKQYWVVGIEHAVRPVKQTFVVMVPGSEGNPGYYEQRTREIPKAYPIPHRYSFDDIVCTSVAGKKLDLDAASKSIAKFQCFLFVPAGKTVSKQSRMIFNGEMVIVTPKQK